MQIEINELTLARVFDLSQFVKEKCKDKSNLEQVAQELMKTLCQTIVTNNDNSAIVLGRLFKSCSYSDLTEDIQNYIQHKEDANAITPESKFLTLLGTWGELEEWQHREESKNYKAFSLNDKDVLYKFPMLSAVFKQIGYRIPTEKEPDKSIIIDNQDKEYGVFYVKHAIGNKLVPKQAEFVEPYGIKSVIGFGGRYGNNNIYSIILFLKEYISRQTAELFPSLNPAIKFLTLRHEMTGNIFNSDELIETKIDSSSVALKETNDKNDFQNVEYEIRTEEAVAMANELKMANNSLTKMAKELNEKNALLMEEISVRKLMEEALVQSEKLKSLGIVTAGISHEFNNLLMIIIGNAELLDGNFDDNQKLQQSLNTIIKASDDGAAIVKNMLLYAKSHEKDTSDFLFFDIRHVLGEAIDFATPRWKSMAQAQGIDYQIDREGMKEIPETLCSPTELRGVFINIINNALDAMPDGGRLTFCTSSDENTIFISISDTGTGMSQDVKERIFDPFFTTRRPLGTGLGMSVSYGVIKRHAGEIVLDSEEGKGTTFNLRIPIKKDASQKSIPHEPAHNVARKNLHILVIDDNEDVRVIVDNILTDAGHTVKTVDNGMEAIELAGKEDFDLVLCDLLMPEVHGYDVIKAFNESDKTQKIGIITGWDDKLKPLDDEEFKVDFILKKPFKQEELENHINNLII